MDFEDDIDALYATYQSLLPMTEADSERLWQKFRLDWNYNSNRIEGNTLTRGETKALLEEGIKPIKMRKDILQMESHDKAIDVLREFAESDRPLTEADIRALHKTALGENYWNESVTIDGTITRREIEIGTYKQKPNMVRKQDGTEHVYAQPNEVPALMAETMKRLRRYLKKSDKPLHDFLAELHQDFIETHPFDDGNGRVVRLLINYVCLHLNWPPVIIKSEKRSEYIASLESWNDGDERPFRDLMKRELIWSLKKSVAAARGEDIEDDGDLDKEIDLFVRDKSSELDENLFARKTLIQTAFRDYQGLSDFLDSKFKKFSNLFSSYDRDFKFNDTYESCNGVSSQTFTLYDWQASEVSKLVHIKLSYGEEDGKASIIAELEIFDYSDGDFIDFLEGVTEVFQQSPLELIYDPLDLRAIPDVIEVGKKIIAAFIQELKEF